MLKLAIMIERRQRMHKWTHYERMMNMDLFVQPPVIVDKNGGEFKLDYRSIIIGTLKTYDFTKDKVYGRGPFAHIPQAFLDNKYVSTYIEIATDLFDKSEEAGLLPKEQEASYTDGECQDKGSKLDSAKVRVPRHAIQSKINYSISPMLKGSLSGKYVGETRDFGNGNTGGCCFGYVDQILSDYYVFNLVTTYKIFNGFQATFNIGNILDEEYEQAYQYSSIGRTYNFGIRRVY